MQTLANCPSRHQAAQSSRRSRTARRHPMTASFATTQQAAQSYPPAHSTRFLLGERPALAANLDSSRSPKKRALPRRGFERILLLPTVSRTTSEPLAQLLALAVTVIAIASSVSPPHQRLHPRAARYLDKSLLRHSHCAQGRSLHAKQAAKSPAPRSRTSENRLFVRNDTPWVFGHFIAQRIGDDSLSLHAGHKPQNLVGQSKVAHWTETQRTKHR